MNLINKILLPTLLITSVVQAKAQVPPEFRASHNQVMKMHNQQFLGMQRLGHFHRYDPSSNYKREYTVMLKDSTRMVVKSKFELDTVQKKFFLQYIDINKRKSDSTRIRRIYPNETTGIAVRTPSGWSTNKGIAADSCWLFPEIKGRITVYTMFADIQSMEEEFARAYSVDDGPVLVWDLQAIRTIISENPDSRELMNEGKYLKAIKQFNIKAKKEAKKEIDKAGK